MAYQRKKNNTGQRSAGPSKVPRKTPIKRTHSAEGQGQNKRRKTQEMMIEKPKRGRPRTDKNGQAKMEKGHKNEEKLVRKKPGRPPKVIKSLGLKAELRNRDNSAGVKKESKRSRPAKIDLKKGKIERKTRKSPKITVQENGRKPRGRPPKKKSQKEIEEELLPSCQTITVKKPRGRPPKKKNQEEIEKELLPNCQTISVKKPRGRPPKKKNQAETEKESLPSCETISVKRPRGRPKVARQSKSDQLDNSNQRSLRSQQVNRVDTIVTTKVQIKVKTKKTKVKTSNVDEELKNETPKSLTNSKPIKQENQVNEIKRGRGRPRKKVVAISPNKVEISKTETEISIANPSTSDCDNLTKNQSDSNSKEEEIHLRSNQCVEETPKKSESDSSHCQESPLNLYLELSDEEEEQENAEVSREDQLFDQLVESTKKEINPLVKVEVRGQFVARAVEDAAEETDDDDAGISGHEMLGFYSSDGGEDS